MPFDFKKIELNGIIIIEPKVFFDDRGFFIETYKKSDFEDNGICCTFVQDNHSFSLKGVLRGLHYQREPKSQGKLVQVVKGSVWDVVVDIRVDSPTFKKWYGIELSEENKKMLFMPPGFAHGFVALSDDVHLTYKCTAEYDVLMDAGIRWTDPDIAIEWPVSNPIVSKKDEKLPFINETEIFQ